MRDRDRSYGEVALRRLRAMGIRDKPIAPASPWQNGFAERLIGSIRRECVDHIVVWGEGHLRRVLRGYARYYNNMRTHRSLDKDAPAFRSVQRVGTITSYANTIRRLLRAREKASPSELRGLGGTLLSPIEPHIHSPCALAPPVITNMFKSNSCAADG
jgi:transposase InsO family protein